MNYRNVTCALAMTMVAAMPAASLADAGTDPFLGVWVLNAKASRYGSNDRPHRMVIVMRETPQGVHYQSTSLQVNGQVTSSEYTAAYDGRLALVSGGAGMMAPVSIKRIDAHTVEASYMRGFHPVAVSRRVVSGDGHTMTVTTSYRDPAGATVVNVAVYSKAP